MSVAVVGNEQLWGWSTRHPMFHQSGQIVQNLNYLNKYEKPARIRYSLKGKLY